MQQTISLQALAGIRRNGRKEEDSLKFKGSIESRTVRIGRKIGRGEWL